MWFCNILVIQLPTSNFLSFTVSYTSCYKLSLFLLLNRTEEESNTATNIKVRGKIPTTVPTSKGMKVTLRSQLVDS